MNASIMDLKTDASRLSDPVDERVVEALRERAPLDDVYFETMRRNHGGEPGRGTFDTREGPRHIALLLTLLDEKSALQGPCMPHFEHDLDARVVQSVDFLKNYEHATSRGLFGRLFPFAAMKSGEWCLDRCGVDLLCFDCRDGQNPPPVVLWKADEAHAAYMRWDRLPVAEAFDGEDYANVPWDDFLEPIAPSFEALITELRLKEA